MKIKISSGASVSKTWKAKAKVATTLRSTSHWKVIDSTY